MVELKKKIIKKSLTKREEFHSDPHMEKLKT